MNPAEQVLKKVDRLQQRIHPVAFVFGVSKKYGDDNGGVLVANLTYTAFVTIFPLLLVLVTILGLVAAGSPGFRQDAINAVASQVPLIGTELTGNVHQLQKSSVIGLIVGLASLIWGTTGLAQAGLYTMEQVWNLPGPARPGFFPRLARSLLFLVLLGFVVIATSLLAGLSTYGHNALPFVVLAEAVEAVVNSTMFFIGFRILTPRGVPSKDLVRGAVLAGICWTILQVLGAYLIHHYLHSDSVYGVFATVLGLVAWLYLAARITVYCAEINAVLARRLWPRSIVQPPLTEADRTSMALQALQNQRRKEQQVTVTFDDRTPGEQADSWTPAAPETPQQVSPPAPPPARNQELADEQDPDQQDADRPAAPQPEPDQQDSQPPAATQPPAAAQPAADRRDSQPSAPGQPAPDRPDAGQPAPAPERPDERRLTAAERRDAGQPTPARRNSGRLTAAERRAAQEQADA